MSPAENITFMVIRGVIALAIVGLGFYCVAQGILLATHLNGKPLTVEHGAPLRLLVPVKLGLKNIKAITRITYTTDEPPDYWAKRGYSRYDGI